MAVARRKWEASTLGSAVFKGFALDSGVDLAFRSGLERRSRIDNVTLGVRRCS
jgi:hypothetical protein